WKSPLGLAVTHDGRLAYVALHGADAVAVVDLVAGRVLREIAVGRQPHDVALHDDILFVTCTADDTLVTLDLPGRSVIRRQRIGQAPRGLAVEPAGSRVYVACHDEAALFWLEVSSSRIRSVAVPPWPHRVAWHGGPVVLSAAPGQALLSWVNPDRPE